MEKDIEKLEMQYGYNAVKHLWDKLFEVEKIDPKKYRFSNSGNDVFPFYAAPVFCREKRLEPMVYSVFPLSKYSSYNARADNLTSDFWKDAFLKHHGFVALKCFREWVAVKDLVNSQQVSLQEVQDFFEKQRKERENKIVASGKKYRPTKTEIIPITERQVIVEFKPRDHPDVFAPVIFSYKQDLLGGFAIVTKKPFRDVHRVGHDRSPILLSFAESEEWLAVADRSKAKAFLESKEGEMSFNCSLFVG